MEAEYYDFITLRNPGIYDIGWASKSGILNMLAIHWPCTQLIAIHDKNTMWCDRVSCLVLLRPGWSSARRSQTFARSSWCPPGPINHVHGSITYMYLQLPRGYTDLGVHVSKSARTTVLPPCTRSSLSNLSPRSTHSPSIRAGEAVSNVFFVPSGVLQSTT